MDLSLGFLFCSIDLYFCLCANTILFWWLWLCSIVWSQAGWFLQFHSFTSGWPVFPAPLVKEVVFFPLNIFASFVKDKVSTGSWIYFWAFYSVPLIYISVFVPVPYCLDDCGFVVEPEVRQVDSSSSILLSQIALIIRGFLCFHTNYEIICSSLWKIPLVTWQGLHWIYRLLWVV